MFEEVSYAITDISIMDNIIKDLEREFAKKK
jgi:hypothetical protein